MSMNYSKNPNLTKVRAEAVWNRELPGCLRYCNHERPHMGLN